MTTTEITTPATADVLAGMFTENTGRHILDSGGAYGRNWERNQGRDAASFLNEPPVYFEVYRDSETDEDGDFTPGEWYPAFSAFHFLNDRLEFDAELQDKFDATDAAMPDARGWPEVIDAFMSEHYPEANVLSVNTYNHDNLLDQVLQYWQVSEQGDACYPDFVILQVHGGCDVRGGYTAPKLFTVVGMCEVGLLDDNDVTVFCEGVEPPQRETLPGFTDAEPVQHRWYSDDGGYHWYSDDGHDALENTHTDGDGHAACNLCGAPLHINYFG